MKVSREVLWMERKRESEREMEEREGEREIGQSVLFWIECVWYFFNYIYIYIYIYIMVFAIGLIKRL